MKNNKGRILVVDDDEQIADILSLRMESEGYNVDTCGGITRCIDLMTRNRYSLVLLDVQLRDGNGVDSLPRIRDVDAEVPIFVITAHGDVDSAVLAFSRGANGYIRKPFQEGDLRTQISHAVEAYHMKLEVLKQRRFLSTETDVEKIIFSRDPVMKPLLDQIRTASATNSNVVVYGPSGTGKELVARALHQLGPRAKGNFVAINCGAVPESLLESELFGYMKGAFTDARLNKVGHIVRANGGTLFLDEIGDAPQSIQVRLLRVLQEREVMPLGSDTAIKVDVRIVAATHRDLRALVAEGKFREDLFYRLQVLPFYVPPLKDRRQDIMYLANIFAVKFSKQQEKRFEGFSTSAVEAIQNHGWPGNVRELQNRVEHAIVMGRGSIIISSDLFPEGSSHSPNSIEKEQALVEEVGETSELGAVAITELDGGDDIPSYKEAKEHFEKRYAMALLKRARGNIALAARIAGKYRTEVYGLIRKYSLNPNEFK